MQQLIYFQWRILWEWEQLQLKDRSEKNFNCFLNVIEGWSFKKGKQIFTELKILLSFEEKWSARRCLHGEIVEKLPLDILMKSLYAVEGFLLKTVISLGKFHLCKSRLALLKNQPRVKKSSAEIDLLDFKEDWHSNKWKRPNGTNKGTKTCAKCRFNSSLTRTLLKEPFFLIIMRSQELFVVF